MEQLLELDKKLFLALNALGQPWLDDVMLLITGIWLWIPLYLGVTYLFFKHFSTSQAVIFTALCVLAFAITDAGSVHLFKEQFQRLRPCQEEDLLAQMRYIAVRCGKYGFVSSHASSTFGFAILAGSILKTKLPNAKILLLLWAAVVSYSRIYVGVHYPGDIVGGALFGTLVGALLFLVAKKQFQIDKEK